MQRENYRLRTLGEADLEKVLIWRNSDRIRAVMFNDRIITRDEHWTWFAKTKHEEAVYLIFEWRGQAVGLVYFTHIDRYHHRCFWGFYLGEEGLLPGSGGVMGEMGLRYAFETLKMRKVCSEVLAFNLTSIRYHRKLGFVEESRFIRHVLKNGVYQDVVAFACFSGQ